MLKNTLLLLLGVYASTALADDSLNKLQYMPTNRLQASITVGYGGIENPINNAKNITSPVLPHLAYYGDNWYFDDFTIGYTLHENRRFYVDIAGTFNEDGFFFELDGVSKLFAVSAVRGTKPGQPQASPIFLNPIERSLSYEAGLVGGVMLGAFKAELSVLHDITSTHNGLESKLNLFYGGELGKGDYLLETGATYKSAELIEYYYRVRPGETLTRLAQYDLGGSGINYHIKAQYHYPISRHWATLISVKHTWIDSDLGSTPMFEKSNYVTGFMGVTYEF